MLKFNKVLIVDDDDAALFVAKNLIKRMNIAGDILTAMNGLDAFKLIRDACDGPEEDFPGLMLVDLKMPVMNGFKLIEAMQGLKLPFKPLVVVLTSSSNTIDREKARNLQTDGYLIKPIKEDSIEQLLQDLSLN